MFDTRIYLRPTSRIRTSRSSYKKEITPAAAFNRTHRKPSNDLNNPQQKERAVKARPTYYENPHSLLSLQLIRLQRVLEFLVFTGCFGLCVYQLYDRGTLYLSEPTSVESIITRNDTIMFPAITFCSGTKKFLKAIMYDMMEQLNNSVKEFDNLWNITFADYGLNLDQLWNDNGLNGSAITATVISKMPTSFYGIYTPFVGITKSLDTAYCNCITFTPDQALELKGQTSVTFKIDHEHLFREDSVRNHNTTLYYKFHDAHMNQRHEAMGYSDYLPDQKIATVTLRIKKFSYQNKKRFNCLNAHEAFARQLKCIDIAIRRASIPCRYPFINSKTDLQQCTTINDTYESSERLHEVYDEPDVILCHKKQQICSETVHSYPPPVFAPPKVSRYTALEIILPDNTFEMVRESFTYSFAALLSDVGGSLGFFLGISVLTLVDALREGLRLFSQSFPKNVKTENKIDRIKGSKVFTKM